MTTVISAGRILIVDDDPMIRQALREILELENYTVSEAENGEQLRQILTDANFDLVTLDIGLPGVSGLELAREIRQKSSVSIIIVSARNTDIDKIVGLEVGADDYVVKPFNVREVLARIRAVLRRTAERAKMGSGELAVHSFHNYQFNLQNRKLTSSSGTTAVLTSAESDLLTFLLKNAGRSCSRDEITAAMKGHGWSPFDRSLDTLVARLRRKIEPDPNNPSLIMSIRGVGYRLASATASTPE